MQLTEEQKQFFVTKKQSFLSLAKHAQVIKNEVREHFDKDYRGQKMKVSTKAENLPMIAGKFVFVHGVADVFSEDNVTVMVSPYKNTGEVSNRTVIIPIRLIESVEND